MSDIELLYDNLLLSLKQIVSPFQLFLIEDIYPLNELCRLAAFIESILTTTFIAFFLLGLRWNFKRE